MKNSTYIIDASSLIEMKDKYPEETFPGVWKKMEELYKQGRLLAPFEVREELLDDELKIWVKNKKKMFISPDDKQIKLVKEILLNYPFLAKPEKLGGPNADPWLIALAVKLKDENQDDLFCRNKYIIVTEESKAKKTRIPAVAKNYGIDSISLKELFKNEGWKF